MERLAPRATKGSKPQEREKKRKQEFHREAGRRGARDGKREKFIFFLPPRLPVKILRVST
jgi:hypothetical protein